MNVDELSLYITGLLRELCESGRKIQPDTELLESGLLDSYAFLQLLTALEDNGYDIQPTRHPKECFSSARSIAAICAEYADGKRENGNVGL